MVNDRAKISDLPEGPFLHQQQQVIQQQVYWQAAQSVTDLLQIGDTRSLKEIIEADRNCSRALAFRETREVMYRLGILSDGIILRRIR